MDTMPSYELMCRSEHSQEKGTKRRNQLKFVPKWLDLAIDDGRILLD